MQNITSSFTFFKFLEFPLNFSLLVAVLSQRSQQLVVLSKAWLGKLEMEGSAFGLHIAPSPSFPAFPPSSLSSPSLPSHLGFPPAFVTHLRALPSG